jgi:hypothetical protein
MPPAPEPPRLPPPAPLVAIAQPASPARGRLVLALAALVGALSFVSFATWIVRAWLHR